MSRLPLVVIDADVLGRRRTGDETYVANLLRELGTLAPIGSPAGRGDPPARSRAGGDRADRAPRPEPGAPHGLYALPRFLRRLGPALGHFQYAIPAGFPSPGRRHDPRSLLRA